MSSPFLRPLVVLLLAGLAAAAVRAEEPVLVSITGPLVGRVGDSVSFEVELVNRSGRQLQGLRVIDYFDAGFHHVASASPIEQKGTIDLAPGTARRLTLDFLLDEPGRQCHRVVILDQAQQNLGGAQHCVEVAPNAAFVPPPAAPPSTVNVPQPPRFDPPAVTAPPPLVPPPTTPLAAAPLAAAPLAATVPLATGSPAIELDLTGPAEVLAGDMVSYVAIIRNNGTAASQPATLEFSWDQQLLPRAASEGIQLAGTKGSWAIPAIEPKGAQERQIKLEAQAVPGAFRDSPPTRACVRAVLSGLAGGSQLADEACVAVASTTPRPRVRSPSEAGLRVTLADLHDPVRSGDATTLVCTVSNNGTLPSGPLDVVVLLPDGGRMVGDPLPTRVRVEIPRVSFGPVASIPPGGRQAFEVSYRLPGSGTGTASATLRGEELAGSLDGTCQTTFLEP